MLESTAGPVGVGTCVPEERVGVSAADFYSNSWNCFWTRESANGMRINIHYIRETTN